MHKKSPENTSMKYIIIMVFLISHLFSAQDLDKVTLQLHWYHQFQFAGYYMAKEKGFYEEAGMDVEIKEVNLSQDIVENVIQQKTDYATGSTSLIADRAHGKKIVLLAAIFQDSPVVIVTKVRPDIQKIEDFSGKHIDASGTMIDSLSIRAFLNEKNITVEPSKHVHLHSDIKESLLSDHADGIVLYNADETYQLDKMGIHYKIFHPKDYGFTFYNDLLFSSEEEVKKHPKRAQLFKEASLKGWEYAFSHIDETIQLILDKYNTQNKTYNELNYQAHAFKKLAYYRTTKLGNISNQNILRIYDAYKKLGLVKNDLGLKDFILQNDQSVNTIFNSKEKIYLQKKKEILVCGANLWRPYIDQTSDRPTGILVELTEAYEKVVGVPFRFVRTKSWEECLSSTQKKEIDIAIPRLKDQTYHRDLAFTKPITKDDVVLVSKVKKPFLSDISNAGTLKVSICKGNNSYIDDVKSKYPNLELIFVNDLQEGLQSVAQDKVDAYLGAILPVTYKISHYYPEELKIIGRFTGLSINESIAVHHSNQILLDILNKTIDAVGPKVQRDIYSNWINMHTGKKVDHKMIWQIVIGALILLFILYYRHNLLKKERDKLRSAYEKINKQQKELQEQKTLHELAFESVTDGVLMLKDGKFVDCNLAVLKMLQYTQKEDLLNLSPAELSPKYQPDGILSSQKAADMIELAFYNGVNRFEWIHTKATGEDFWTEVTLTPIEQNNKKLLHVLWRDISKQKKLEYDNSVLHERMQLAFSASRDGLWDWDIKNNTYYFSPRWKEMLGYKDWELENNLETWRALVHPDDLKKADKEILRYLDGKTDIYEHKHRLRHKDGHWVWIYDRGRVQFDDIGNAVRMIGTHTDLTNEINLSNKLSELNHKLETTIEIAIADLKKSQAQAKLGSWKLDLVHDILTWSDETYNIFEVPRTMDMITYKHFINAIHPEDKEKVETAYYNSLKTQEPYEVEHRLLMPDGRIKYVKENCETTFDSNGEPLLSVGTIQDITTEHQAVEELRRKDKILFRQSRMAQMGEMISMIAHQWRQPLNAITLTTSALELKIKNDTYDKTFFHNRLERISNYVQHLSSTIDDFREFFKTDKKKEDTTFAALIERTLELVQTGLESKNITIRTECHSKHSISTYANEVLQVIMNLIKNAEDALLENNTTDPTITIKCYSDSEKSVLEIGDNAGGIDTSIMDKIFDPYFTTKKEHDGTGLGLYMSKLIIDEHCNGTLSFYNNDVGAVFKIELSHS